MDFIVALLKKLPIIPIALGIGGVILGLLIGWVIAPVEFVDATPSYLRADLQEDYLRMAIDSYRLNQSQDLAVQRWQNLGLGAQAAFTAVQANPGSQDPAVIKAYGDVITSVLSAGGGQPADAGGSAGSSTMRNAIIIFGSVLVVGVLGAAGFYLYRLLGNRGSGEVTPAMRATEINRNTEKTDYESLGIATPITQVVSTYVFGDDLFDESFSVDAPDGKFLGEFGASISYAIGVGDNKKVTALEVWLYDLDDIETSTKVLTSDYAYKDQEIHTRLKEKGEVVLINLKDEVLLETKRLQLLIKVLDFEYGVGAMPPSSYFQRAILELTVWYRN